MLNPFMSFESEDTLSQQLVETFSKTAFHLPESQIRDAVSAGWKELAMTRLETRKKVRKSLITWKIPEDAELFLPVVHIT